LLKICPPPTFSDLTLVISGLLACTGIVGMGTAESDLGLMLFGVGSTDEELFRDIANYKREVRNNLSLCLSFT
jgi:hypothetical protein